MPALFLASAALLLVWTTEGSRGEGLRPFLHWPERAGQWATVILAALFANAVDYGASIAIDAGGNVLGLRSAWAEVADEIIMFGTMPEALATTLDLVVFAPLGEELLFRGVLFATLLRWTSVNVAALISAGLFAVWHGYGYRA